jgi:hypothetical protein
MMTVRNCGIVGACVGLAMMVAMWLLNEESSPMYGHTSAYRQINNLITILNIPAFVFGASISGNVHQPSMIATYLGMLAQWTLVGSAIGWLATRWQSRKGSERDA